MIARLLEWWQIAFDRAEGAPRVPNYSLEKWWKSL